MPLDFRGKQAVRFGLLRYFKWRDVKSTTDLLLGRKNHCKLLFSLLHVDVERKTFVQDRSAIASALEINLSAAAGKIPSAFKYFTVFWCLRSHSHYLSAKHFLAVRRFTITDPRKGFSGGSPKKSKPEKMSILICSEHFKEIQLI